VSDYSALHQSYYLGRFIVTADTVRQGVFYLFLSDPKGGSEAGVFVSTDGGKIWSRVFTGQPSEWSYWNAQLAAIPAQEGGLLFTSGPQGDGANCLDLSRSKDGGKSWSKVPNVRAYCVGFGAPLVEGGPAAIYLYGFVNDVRAVWGSADDGATWVKLGTYPNGSLDGIRAISGDMERPGRVYVGFGGSGFAYLDAA
jgi:photosystem II stability/assembly factor-like uncharacterized protein